MGTFGRGRRTFRVAAAAMSSALVIVGLSVVAPGAQSAPPNRLEFTSAVKSPDTQTSPIAAAATKPVRLVFTMTNVSSFSAPIIKFSVTAPPGFAVQSTPAPTAVPGWTTTISGQTVTWSVIDPKGLAGLRPAKSLDLGLTVIPDTIDPALIVKPTTWTVTAGRWTLKGSPPIVNVVGAGTAAFAAAPNVSLNNIAAPGGTGDACALTAANPICDKATLSNGANSNVYFLQRACATTTTGCGIPIEGELSADFGTTLLSNTSPGHFDVTCFESECTHREPGSPIGSRETEPTTGGVANPYNYNFTCSPSTTCGTNYAEREVEEDFAAYPVFVKLKGSNDFVQAPRCQPITNLSTVPGVGVGVIADDPAKAVHFCVDVNAISRARNAFTGDLTLPVLFSEDITVRTTKR